MVKRSLCVCAALLSSALSSATLIQVWNKTYTVGGFTTIFDDVKVDSAGNVYAWGTVLAGDNDAVLIKISPAGSTLWTNRFTKPLNQEAGHLSFDAAGNVIITSTTGLTPAGLELRKIRGSDGATLGSLVYNESSHNVDFGSLLTDPTGQLYWVFQKSYFLSPLHYAVVTKVNTTTLSASTRSLITMPTGHGILDCVGKPTGGLLLLIGSREPGSGGFLDGRYNDADIYTVEPTGAFKANPVGAASRIAVNPENNFVYSLGGYNGDPYISATRSPVGGTLESPATGASGYAGTFIRNALVTRNQSIIGVGSTNSESPNFQESYMTRVDPNSALGIYYNSTVAGTANNEILNTIRLDGFFGLSGTETNGTYTNSRILELDEITGVRIDSRTYPYFIKAHAVNASGLIAIAGNVGGVTLLKPRDMKDIYMSSPTITGGSSRTLNIRMYETYGSPRTVTLSDTGAHLSLPASKTVAGAASTASVTVTTTPVTATEFVTITAAFGSQRRIYEVTVVP